MKILNHGGWEGLSDELCCIWECFPPFPFNASLPVQVDNNVTRHLDSTLKRDDWDVLVLHYLGLDHIGHISGPYSSLVQPKLMEMDDVLKKIHGALVSKVGLLLGFFPTNPCSSSTPTGPESIDHMSE